MSLTVTENVYSYYKKAFDQNKGKLEKKGINSFATYITSMLEELMERNEIFARYAPAMEEFGYDDEGRTVYIKDNRARRRIAAVSLQGKELNCDVDESNDCVHVGFAYSLPKVYKVMGELGIKPPVIRKA